MAGIGDGAVTLQAYVDTGESGKLPSEESSVALFSSQVYGQSCCFYGNCQLRRRREHATMVILHFGGEAASSPRLKER